MRHTDTSEYVTWFVLGGLVGAGVGLLFAPMSGRALRQRVVESAREGALRGRELTDRMVEKGREVADQAADFVEKQRQDLQWRKERVAAALDAGRDAYREEKGQA